MRFFYSERGFLAGGTAKCTPKRHERFGNPAEQDSQEEGERQYRMYQSDRKGTKEYSAGNRRALNSQWRWQILTNSTFCWRGVVPLFSRSSPALRSAEEGKV